MQPGGHSAVLAVGAVAGQRPGFHLRRVDMRPERERRPREGTGCLSKQKAFLLGPFIGRGELEQGQSVKVKRAVPGAADCAGKRPVTVGRKVDQLAHLNLSVVATSRLRS